MVGGAFAVIATTKNRLTSVTARGIMLPGPHKRGRGEEKNKNLIRERKNQKAPCNVNFVAHDSVKATLCTSDARGKGEGRKEERGARVSAQGQTSAAAGAGRDVWVYPEKAQV